MECTVLYCTVLYCTVLHCTALYCTVLYCTVLYCTVLYCTVLYCTVLYCSIVLYHCIWCIKLCQTEGVIKVTRDERLTITHSLPRISARYARAPCWLALACTGTTLHWHCAALLVLVSRVAVWRKNCENPIHHDIQP